MLTATSPKNFPQSATIQQPLLAEQDHASVTIDITPPGRKTLLTAPMSLSLDNQRCMDLAGCAAATCIGLGVGGFGFSLAFWLAGGATVLSKGTAIAGGISLLCGCLMCECAGRDD